MEVTTKASSETQKVGRNFAKQLKGGEILALVGELGAGKTTFVQGLARGLGIKQRINSPTFILMRSYPVTQLPNNLITNFCHIDLYRLEGDLTDEVRNLGLDDIWGKKETVFVIEWAEKIRDIIPKNAIWIKIEITNDDKRKITLK